jgi:hypothetical protein
MNIENTTEGPAPESCPACGSRDVQRIVYGMPVPGRVWAPGEVMGGCVIGPESPTMRCSACYESWGVFGRPAPENEAETTVTMLPPRRQSPLPRKRVGPRRAPAVAPNVQRGKLLSLRSLLRYADRDDVGGLEAWVGLRTELDPFVRIDDFDGSLVVGFHTTGVHIEFPTTIAEFWETVTDLEDQVIEELEAEHQAEIEAEVNGDAESAES